MIVSVHAKLADFSCQVALRDLVELCIFTTYEAVDSCRLTISSGFVHCQVLMRS